MMNRFGERQTANGDGRMSNGEPANGKCQMWWIGYDESAGIKILTIKERAKEREK